ncbi:NB-ARC domain-containing protein [Nonomuraea sp. MTCD27]|uniref:ATP-binding protein n=1 Tax=Nonomuraea sp. MTCD27 TaxID=1676747 RepID=UPI0035BFC616
MAGRSSRWSLALIVLIAAFFATWGLCTLISPDEVALSLAGLSTAVLSLPLGVWASRQPTGTSALPPDEPRHAIVPRQLPAIPPGFVGRTAELARLTALLDSALPDGEGLIVISAIDGMAGIGKTALAIRWAHLVAGRFPDGHLYVNLRGFDPAGDPVSWRDALRGFLDALEVPPERIPADAEAQAALYRSVMSERRMLIVLDNARDAEQVRPLVPGSRGSAVVVTSRHRLTSLMVLQGSYPLTLDVLSDDEARHLLAHRLGRERIDAEPAAVDTLVALCAGLPLALAIVAARGAVHPQFSLAALVAQLRDSEQSLDAFPCEDAPADVRAVFSWSYRHLAEPAAKVFRLLGLHPGHEITVLAVASFVGIGRRAAREALSDLSAAHLVAELTAGRYSQHDLLRAYAGELADVQEQGNDRAEAIDRLLAHYLHSAFGAAVLLHPRAGPLIDIPGHPRPKVVLAEILNYADAISWFETEHATLMATVRLAAETGRYTYAWQLPWTMEEYLDRRGHRNDSLLMQKTAAWAAEREGSTIGQAHAHSALGRAYHWPRMDQESRHHYAQAARLFETLGNPVGHAHALIDISHICEHQGNVSEALIHGDRALELAQGTGDERALARALYFSGWYLAILGQAAPAIARCREALLLERDIGDVRGEAFALDALGSAHHRSGLHTEAVAFHRDAFILFEGFGDRYGQIKSLRNRGDALLAAGRAGEARAVWQQALDIAIEIGDADPGHVFPDLIRDRLTALG